MQQLGIAKPPLPALGDVGTWQVQAVTVPAVPLGGRLQRGRAHEQRDKLGSADRMLAAPLVGRGSRFRRSKHALIGASRGNASAPGAAGIYEPVLGGPRGPASCHQLPSGHVGSQAGSWESPARVRASGGAIAHPEVEASPGSVESSTAAREHLLPGGFAVPGSPPHARACWASGSPSLGAPALEDAHVGTGPLADILGGAEPADAPASGFA